VHISVARLALPVVIGIGVAVTSCSAPGTVKPAVSATQSASGTTVLGGLTAGPAAPRLPGPVPKGYQRIGGTAQGISVAAPASWVALDPTEETAQSVVNQMNLHGLVASTIVQDMAAGQKVHAVFVLDITAAIDSPQRYTPILSAYCTASGLTDTGAAGVPLMKAAAVAEFEKAGATHITQKDLAVGGVPGTEISYQQSSSSAGTLYASQLEVMPKPNKACFVTVGGESEGSVVSVAAATARFP